LSICKLFVIINSNIISLCFLKGIQKDYLFKRCDQAKYVFEYLLREEPPLAESGFAGYDTEISLGSGFAQLPCLPGFRLGQ
jgi:hypothetical protein